MTPVTVWECAFVLPITHRDVSIFIMRRTIKKSSVVVDPLEFRGRKIKSDSKLMSSLIS